MTIQLLYPREETTSLGAADLQEASLQMDTLFDQPATPEALKQAWRAVKEDTTLLINQATPVSPERLDRLATMVAQRLPSLLPDQTQASHWLNRIGDLVNSMPPLGRMAMAVQLSRMFFPFEALETWGPETLFSERECLALWAMPRHSEQVSKNPVAWEQSKGARYGGYVCAILKVTRLCNLRCTYCHDWREGPGNVMNFDVLSKATWRLFSADHDMLDIVWHGGEPLMLGQRQFLKLLWLQRYFARPGQTLRNRLQTNGTRLDGDWISFLRRYDFIVGVSLDGPQETHDAARVDIEGGPTFQAAVKGLELARAAGILSHVYLVVTEDIIEMGAPALLDFLLGLGINLVGMLPARSSNVGKVDQFTLERTRFLTFLLDLYDARQARPKATLEIRELDALMKAARSEDPGHCELLGNCAGFYFSVDPNGDVYHCDKYVGDPEYKLGSVLFDDFLTIRRSAAMNRLKQRFETRGRTETTCPHRSKCQGWCPHEGYLADLAGAQAGGCCGLAPFFDGLKERAAQ